MEIGNLEKSPSGLSRSGIIAPTDTLSKCNLVYNQSALMPNDLGENKTFRQEELHIHNNSTGKYNPFHSMELLYLVTFH